MKSNHIGFFDCEAPQYFVYLIQKLNHYTKFFVTYQNLHF
jgi:hypothetical protein